MGQGKAGQFKGAGSKACTARPILGINQAWLPFTFAFKGVPSNRYLTHIRGDRTFMLGPVFDLTFVSWLDRSCRSPADHERTIRVTT